MTNKKTDEIKRSKHPDKQIQVQITTISRNQPPQCIGSPIMHCLFILI